MLKTQAYAAAATKQPLAPFTIERRSPGARDVLIDIAYCGVCHSDIHQARDEWGGAIFPMVPGHEVVGHVVEVGAEVTRWRAGDRVGVGCFVDTCRTCEACRAGDDNYCLGGIAFTYNGRERDGVTPTYGGYSTRITVDERYVLGIPANLPLASAAPLLCAGITTWAPLHYFGVKPGQEVAVLGLGGLGHMGVKLAKALGARVTVLSSSDKKRDDAARLGADDFVLTSAPGAFEKNALRFHHILDTVSARHDYGAYANLLRRDGNLMLVGLPEEPAALPAGALISRRRRVVGSMIGSIAETQAMLDFCGQHGIGADVEVIAMQQINEAYERVLTGDVRYRFSIDLASLK